MTEALNLFLIEDDDDVAFLMLKCLERAGHQVTRCRTAADALIVLGQTPFDLALLDQKLPDMEGLTLLQALARENITVPVLMVTGHGDEELAAEVLRVGALDYVVKDPRLGFLADLPRRVADSVSRHRLEQHNALLRQALESARDGVLIADLQGNVLHLNKALEDITGYSRDELLGSTPEALFGDPNRPGLYQEMWRTALGRSSWQGELTARRKDGAAIEASLTFSPILDAQGRLTHFIAILRDVTAHKQLERQLVQAQKMQSVGTLAGGVAHEFNNLLAGISGYASLGLREAGVPVTAREFFLNVVNLSERAALLTRQLLAFARKPSLTRRPTAIPDLVRETADLVARTMQLDVRADVRDCAADGSHLVVEADGNQLQQALINLALNARDAILELRPPGAEDGAPPPGAFVCFRARDACLPAEWPAFPQHIPPGQYVLIEVEDSGRGMTADVLGQALDPFFTTKEVGRGTGLGLPVVFGIVQGHQGYLSLRSAPTSGTCVGIYLPRLVRPAPEAGRPQPDASHDLEPESTPGYSILVVDDEQAVLDVVRRFLEIAGHRVTGASSGQEALDTLQRGQHYDLVILDLMMPREDSATTFRRLRDRWPGLPVLICTGLLRDDAPGKLLSAGAVGLLRKPFRMTELWYAVKQALTPTGG